MRSSACKQEIDIDASSFIYGHCPHTVTTTPPDDRTEGSGYDSDDEDDDYEAGTGDAEDEKKENGEKKGQNDKKRGKDVGAGADAKHMKSDPDDDGIDGSDDGEDDLEEDLPHPDSDLNEKDAFRSKLCRNTICPIGALCKLRRESGAGDQDQAYCDCRHMCARVQQLSLATTWIKSSVCGSNGIIYPNECRLRQDSCNKNTTIHILPGGNCPRQCVIHPLRRGQQ